MWRRERRIDKHVSVKKSSGMKRRITIVGEGGGVTFWKPDDAEQGKMQV